MTERELHLTASYRCVDRCRVASCIQRVLSLSLRVCAQRARPRVVDLKPTLHSPLFVPALANALGSETLVDRLSSRQ